MNDEKKDPCERLEKFFGTSHLRGEYIDIVLACRDLALYALQQCPHNQELTLGLRALIVAKDEFVRSMIPD